MNKVLLTGAGGFVGHHTLLHLLKTTDWNFVATDSFKHYGTSARLRSVFEDFPEAHKRVKVITHDLTTPIDNITKNEFGKINTVINMASESHVHRAIINPRPFVENNVALVLTMLEYARTLDTLDCFIQISTDEVYGSAPKDIFHKEWDPFIPSNPYSASKACQEAIVTSYWRSYDIPAIITNTMNIIGERQDVEKFVPTCINNILNNKKTFIHAQKENDKWVAGSRFYLHARNQADALKFIIEKFKNIPHKYSDGLVKPEKFNVCGEVEVFNDELIFMIGDILNIDIKPIIEYESVEYTRPGHDLRYALDGKKIKDLGWNSPIPFYQSLEKTVLWTKENSKWLL